MQFEVNQVVLYDSSIAIIISYRLDRNFVDLGIRTGRTLSSDTVHEKYLTLLPISYKEFISSTEEELKFKYPELFI